MADTKISALPASTTPLAGTEVLPIVQSSTTKQVSVANLTAGRSVSASALTASTGDVTSTAGNLVVSTSGKGVTTGSSIPLGLGVNGGTTSVTIDTAGKVGIANTSPTVDLEIGSNTSTVRAFSVRYSSVPGYLSNTYDGSVGLTTLSCNSYNTSSGSASWSSFSNTLYGCSAIQLASGTGGDIRFLTASAVNTAPTESGRFTTGGVLWINQTASLVGAKLEVTSTGINHCFYRSNATGGNTLAMWLSDNHGTASTAAYFRVDGGLANYQAYDANLSDERVKKDISLAGSYLQKICSIPVKTFRFKSESSDDPLTLGVLAQDVEAVAPELVDANGWGLETQSPQDGEPLKAIYQTDLQYALMKCIQEQQQLIEQLIARVNALENR